MIQEKIDRFLDLIRQRVDKDITQAYIEDLQNIKDRVILEIEPEIHREAFPLEVEIPDFIIYPDHKGKVGGKYQFSVYAGHYFAVYLNCLTLMLNLRSWNSNQHKDYLVALRKNKLRRIHEH